MALWVLRLALSVLAATSAIATLVHTQTSTLRGLVSKDNRLQALCRRMKLFDFWEVNGPPDHCELSAGTLVCR